MENIKELVPLLNLVPLGLVFVLWGKADKSKAHADETFQRKDLCEQTVDTVKGDLTEIKADVKTLLSRQ